jgi:small subunit ribosomal protein S6
MGAWRLAYEIEKKSDGIYAVSTWSRSRTRSTSLTASSSLNEAVLRTKILRPERH